MSSPGERGPGKPWVDWTGPFSRLWQVCARGRSGGTPPEFMPPINTKVETWPINRTCNGRRLRCGQAGMQDGTGNDGSVTPGWGRGAGTTLRGTRGQREASVSLICTPLPWAWIKLSHVVGFSLCCNRGAKLHFERHLLQLMYRITPNYTNLTLSKLGSGVIGRLQRLEQLVS